MARGSAATRSPEVDDLVAIRADHVSDRARVALIRLCGAGFVAYRTAPAAHRRSAGVCEPAVHMSRGLHAVRPGRLDVSSHGGGSSGDGLCICHRVERGHRRAEGALS
jgi:hypothetical protein